MKTTTKLLITLPLLITQPTLLAATTDFALSAELGTTRQSGDGESGNATSGSVGLSYQITPNWSVLLNYSDSGEADYMRLGGILAGDEFVYDATLSLDNTSTGLSAQYQTERQIEQWFFGGRVGLVYWDTDLNMTVHSSPEISLTALSDKGTNLSAGIFAHYGLTEKWDLTLGLDYLRYRIEASGGDTDVTTTKLYVGLKNSF